MTGASHPITPIPLLDPRQIMEGVDREPSVGELYAAYNCGVNGFINRFEGKISKCPVTTQKQFKTNQIPKMKSKQTIASKVKRGRSHYRCG